LVLPLLAVVVVATTQAYKELLAVAAVEQEASKMQQWLALLEQ
jgi:hypothetical protein